MTAVPAPDRHPVQIEIDYPKSLSRVKTLLRLLLVLPHIVALLLYVLAACAISVPAFLIVLLSGRMAEGFHAFVLAYDRYALRVLAYLFLLTDRYPPFGGVEDATYPVRLRCERAQSLSRLHVLIKWLIILPHVLILMFYALAVVIVVVLAWWIILLSGRYPRDLFDFVAGFLRWNTRVAVYAGQWGYIFSPFLGGLLTDKYPSFSDT